MKKISRRNFLHSSAVAAGVAAVSTLAACSSTASSTTASSSSTSETTSWDYEADAVIVGGGGTGLAAGRAAVDAGASVIILEKAGITGGTTTFSGGVMQAAGTSYQKELTSFGSDTPANHANEWIAEGEGYVDEELVKALAEGAPAIIDWEAELPEIKWVSVYGHCHVPTVPRELEADRIHVYEGGGAAGQGGVLTSALANYCKEKGVNIMTNTAATRLITENGEVIGVEAETEEKVIRVKAKKGVILAAASVDQNKEMAKRLAPQQYWALENGTCMCVAGDTGDGLRMGMEIGADLYGQGGTIDFCGTTGNATNITIPTMPCIIVNKAGQRFVCEDATYAYQYRAIFQQEKQLGGKTYMVFGQEALSDPGAIWTAETVADAVAAGTLLSADTLEELAAAMDCDAANLAASVASWNEMVSATGEDRVFGRRTGLNTITGPFYAMMNVPCNLGSIVGLRINANCQVLDVNGQPISRLYAGGMNAGGWIGPYYPGSGTAIIGTQYHGKVCGEQVAALTAWC